MATANATAPDRVCSQANHPVAMHTPRATRTVEFVAIHPAANDDGNVLVMIGSALDGKQARQPPSQSASKRPTGAAIIQTTFPIRALKNFHEIGQ